MDKLIECREITKKYNNHLALNEVNINIYDGDIYGLVGPNGAGKSTFLKLLAGYIKSTTGEIEILGESEKNANKIRNEIGFLIENPPFYSYLSGEKNLKYLCKLKGLEYNDEIKEMVRLFNIEGVLNKKVKSYSTGMRQRLGIVAAMMSKPKILVLDEPINGLDPSGIIELRNILLKINKEWNTTIIVSSHILNELALIATRIGFIKNGKILEEITNEELKNKNRRCIEIIIDKDLAGKVIAILETKLNIIDYKILAEDKINIFDDVNIIDIQRELAKSDIFTKSILNKSSSLEDYYIKIMGDDINE